MHLIQILLPRVTGPSDERADDPVASTRRELVDAFGGLTAYLQTPAHGVWTAPGGAREQDQVVMVEVVADRFDRHWWRDYAARLAARFGQEAIHVRAVHVEVLDDDAT